MVEDQSAYIKPQLESTEGWVVLEEKGGSKKREEGISSRK